MADETVATVRKVRGAAVLDLQGDVTSFSEPVVKRAWAEAMASGARYILLNFQKVQYMNSAGIAILIDLVAEARKSARPLALVWQNDHFQKILKMVGLTRYLPVYATETEALQAREEWTTAETGAATDDS
ncbi:MAG: STAS domain-containing protein [Armatimonadota bacterium]|nr:STAS domain-containing protein [Armatimonadota bacterium]